MFVLNFNDFIGNCSANLIPKLAGRAFVLGPREELVAGLVVDENPVPLRAALVEPMGLIREGVTQHLQEHIAAVVADQIIDLLEIVEVREGNHGGRGAFLVLPVGPEVGKPRPVAGEQSPLHFLRRHVGHGLAECLILPPVPVPLIGSHREILLPLVRGRVQGGGLGRFHYLGNGLLQCLGRPRSREKGVGWVKGGQVTLGLFQEG